MKRIIFALCLALAPALSASAAVASTRPRLLLTPSAVTTIRENLGKYPLYDAAYEEAKAAIDKVLQAPVDVPTPKDAAGYTHERHKRNYFEMQLAGFLYQVTRDAKYVNFIKSVLDRYAQMYPTLGVHPQGRSSSPGRLFHQTLNEAVWLVNTSQAYDCIYEALTPEERTRYENNVLRPMAKFLSDERAHEFDRIHNHGTWAAAAVGMAGYAIGDETLIKKALYGIKMDGSAGYLRQLDELFSPDGYYVEGPYYARYALMPFFIFAEVVDNNDPALKMFERRNQLLRQALYSMLQQTSPTGAFMPFNDALKEKDIRSDEVVLAVDLTYQRYGRDAKLLSVAKRQGAVNLNVSGLEVAKALASTANPPDFPFASVQFTDGPKGDRGGIGILRAPHGTDTSIAFLKYTTFGMEHGHYDKLHFMFYDQGREIVPDYGAARFLNVDQKFGGRYLPENQSFAKQTIAHNTVTVDETSNYGGSYDKAEEQHSDRRFFDASNPDFQVMSGQDRTAYPGVTMQRTVALVRDQRLKFPVVIDVYRLQSDKPHRYDLPYYFCGTFLEANLKLTRHLTQRPLLGEKAGYQHLWVSAEGQAQGPVTFTWMNGDRYYSITSAADSATKVYFTQVGANDPEFNLRNETAFMLRSDGRGSHVFASVLEPHGMWNGVKEQTYGGRPTINRVEVLADTADGTIVRVAGEGGLSWTLMISNAQTPVAGAHQVKVGSETFSWDGHAALRKN